MNRTPDLAVRARYDDLREQGIGHAAAVEFVVQEYGVERRELSAVVRPVSAR